MRKLMVLEMVTLDGVMQAPGGREEDQRGGFTHGAAYLGPEFSGVRFSDDAKKPLPFLR